MNARRRVVLGALLAAFGVFLLVLTLYAVTMTSGSPPCLRLRTSGALRLFAISLSSTVQGTVGSRRHHAG